MVGEQDGRRRRIADVVAPVVAAAIPTAAFQVPNLFVSPGVKVLLVAVGLAVFVAVVTWQVLRARRQARATATAREQVAEALAAYEVAVQYAFGQIATRLVAFADLDPLARRSELGAFADRVAVALAFYLLPAAPDVRANVYRLSAGLDALRAIGHGGAADTAGTFRRGTPYGDRNLEWVLSGGAPRNVDDRLTDVDADDDEDDFDPRYRSYAAVVIRSGDTAWGMLTVDSPAVGAFTDLDVRNLGVMADYLAVAFALATEPVSDPGRRVGA